MMTAYEAKALLKLAIFKLGFSDRAYECVLRIDHTTADFSEYIFRGDSVSEFSWEIVIAEEKLGTEVGQSGLRYLIT